MSDFGDLAVTAAGEVRDVESPREGNLVLPPVYALGIVIPNVMRSEAQSGLEAPLRCIFALFRSRS